MENLHPAVYNNNKGLTIPMKWFISVGFPVYWPQTTLFLQTSPWVQSENWRRNSVWNDGIEENDAFSSEIYSLKFVTCPFHAKMITWPTSLNAGLFVHFLIFVSRSWSATLTRTTGWMLPPVNWRASNTFTRICFKSHSKSYYVWNS